MLRRVATSSSRTATAVRGVSSYNFGQPDLGTDFLPSSHYVSKTGAADAGVRVSQLPTGVRVITHDCQGAHVAVGTYIAAGPKFDPVGVPGLSQVLRYGLSNSNLSDSEFQLDRTARSVGAAVAHVELRKRFIGIKVEAGAGVWERVAQNQWTTLAAPRFAANELDKFRDVMDTAHAEKRFQQPREYCIDNLETVAFNREPLGNPRDVTPVMNDKADAASVLDQWAKFCKPSRMVVAGVNVDHDHLIATYENTAFRHIEDAPHHARAATPTLDEASERDQYYEGNERIEPEFRATVMGTKPNGDEESIWALGFLAPGADNNVKQYAAALVARELASIAFGESLILNRGAVHFGIESFYRPYSSAGLIGATIRTAPGDAKAAIIDAAKTLRSLPTDSASIEIAKQRAAARFAVEHLEVARDYVDFLGTSLVSTGLQSVTAKVILEAISGTDAPALKTVLDIAQSRRPTLFGTGDVYAVPSLRKLSL